MSDQRCTVSSVGIEGHELTTKSFGHALIAGAGNPVAMLAAAVLMVLVNDRDIFATQSGEVGKSD